VDRKTRKLLTTHGQHHPNADIDHLYVPRKPRKWLMQSEEACMVKVMTLMEYVNSKKDPLVQTIIMHQHNTNSTLSLTEAKY